MRLLTKVHIKHTRRQRPDWTEAQLLQEAQAWADAAGPYADTVTAEDVREAVQSMRECQERQETLW